MQDRTIDSRSSISSFKAHRENLKRYWRFLAECCLKALVLLAPLAIAAALLYLPALHGRGEQLPLRQLAAPDASAYLWLSAYYDETADRKPAILTFDKRRVVVFGSSRVWQFRSKMFNNLRDGEFYNMGGANYNLRMMLSNLEKALGHGVRPELMIVGLDFTWFQQESVKRPEAKSTFLPFSSRRVEPMMVKVMTRWEQWSNGWDFLLSRVQLFQRVWRDPRYYQARTCLTEAESGRALLGIRARLSGAGFRNDGSYRETDWIQAAGAGPGSDSARLMQLFRTRLCEDSLFLGNRVSHADLLLLRQFLSLCNDNSIRVIAFLPPVYAPALRVLAASPASSRFWSEFPGLVQTVCDSMGIVLFDFSDPGRIPCASTGFVDYLHGSELLYGCMLRAMCNDPRARAILEPYIDSEKLGREIAAARDRFLIYGD